jgi:hypothetical protein
VELADKVSGNKTTEILVSGVNAGIEIGVEE